MIQFMGNKGTCRSGRDFSGQSALFACGNAQHSFAGVVPAAVRKFGINLEPGETVTITVGAGGVQGTLSTGGGTGPGTAKNERTNRKMVQ